MHCLADRSAERVCPQCGAGQAVGEAEAVWPPRWSCPACHRTVPDIDGIPSFAPDLAGTATGFDVEAFDRLAALETGHYWFEPRNTLLVALADKYFPEARRYLEVGCGTGFVLAAFARARDWQSLTGSEIHPQGLEHARRRLGARASFVQMDARAVPARRAFDLIGAFDVIEHIPEDEAVLANVHRSLAENGGIIVSVPQHPFLWSSADDEAHHERRYRVGELEDKLRRAGFEILWSSSYVSSLFPAMLASRLFKRRGGPDQLATREFNLNPLLNRTLRTILGAEVRASLGWMRWPIGGSRVVVGRKRA